MKQTFSSTLFFFVLSLCLMIQYCGKSLHYDSPFIVLGSGSNIKTHISVVFQRSFYYIHLLHAGERNKKMYSPKSITFKNMILVGEYIFIFPVTACYKCFIILNEAKKTHIPVCKILLASIF